MLMVVLMRMPVRVSHGVVHVNPIVVVVIDSYVANCATHSLQGV